MRSYNSFPVENMTTSEYQQKCYKEYKESIGYPDSYTYLYGNPINPVVPVETALGKVMIVGPYPSARMYKVKNVAEVPLYDNVVLFSNDSYFDGSKVRRIPSGIELNEVILEKIGVRREECWITKLVKVFLFDEDNVKRYKKLGKTDVEANIGLFSEYAKKSISWIQEEIDIANPYVIILLGEEVISALLNITILQASKLLTGEVIKREISWKQSNVICLPHPGLIMKRILKNPWPLKFEVSIAPKAREEINRLRGG